MAEEVLVLLQPSEPFAWFHYALASRRSAFAVNAARRKLEKCVYGTELVRKMCLWHGASSKKCVDGTGPIFRRNRPETEFNVQFPYYSQARH